METKVCRICGQDKPATKDYYWKAPNLDGLRNDCIECARKFKKQYDRELGMRRVHRKKAESREILPRSAYAATFEEIAQVLGVSKNRAMQIYLHALNKLRHNAQVRSMWATVKQMERVQQTGACGVDR